MRNVYRMLVGKPERKRPLGRPERRSEDLNEVGWEGVGWVHVAQDRDRWHVLVNTVLNLRFRKRRVIS
jgi:hypothetical protein